MKTWFITGSSSGIGQGIARAVLEKGDNAVVMARDIRKLDEIVQQYPDTALAVRLELTDKTSIQTAVRLAKERFGGIDVLVNNAGHGYRAAVEEGEDESIAVPEHCCWAAEPLLLYGTGWKRSWRKLGSGNQ